MSDMNNSVNLFQFGYNEKYIIYPNGKVYDTLKQRYCKLYDNNTYCLYDNNNKSKKITLKKLYRIVFNKEYCIDNIKSYDNEIWKEVPNTGGRYLASSCGRIKSCCGYQAKILKFHKTEKDYYRVRIKGEYKKVHRIIAETFLQDFNNNLEVHHKDGNRHNNCLNNLQCLTKQEHLKLHYKGNV